DPLVTGVQTCALPISRRFAEIAPLPPDDGPPHPPLNPGDMRREQQRNSTDAAQILRRSFHRWSSWPRLILEALVEDEPAHEPARSEERRVGKERRCRK